MDFYIFLNAKNKHQNFTLKTRYRDIWKSDNFRERERLKKKQRTDTKRDAKGLRVITLQGAIEKSPILLSQY